MFLHHVIEDIDDSLIKMKKGGGDYLRSITKSHFTESYLTRPNP